MPTRITVVLKGDAQTEDITGPKTREEYYDVYNQAMSNKASSFGIIDVDGDIFVYATDEIKAISFIAE
jgi:hypothetical protein